MRTSHLIILFVIGTLGILATGYFLLIRPQDAQLAQHNELVLEKRNKLIELQAVSLQITDLQDEITRLADALKAFESGLPKEKEIDIVLKQMWQIAERSALKTDRVVSLQPAESDQYRIQPIRVTFNGSFGSFYEFLLDLEQLPRITKVKSIELKKTGESNAQTQDMATQIEANIVMDIFYEE